MTKLTDFKAAHKRFTEALKYIETNEANLKQDETRWQKIKVNFFEKFEKPLDEIWLALSKEERKKMAPLYLHRKAAEDETVKQIIDVFDAKILSVGEE